MSTAIYYKVFGALVALTVLTVFAAEYELGTFVAIAIAAAKAALVGLFFMHLRGEHRFTWFMAVVPVLFFVVLVLFLLPDFPGFGH